MSHTPPARLLAALLVLPASFAATRPARAQQRVTRAEALAMALASGPRLALARADTTAAFARVLAASVFPNPVLSAAYSKSPPQWHLIAELPLDLPGVRSTRIRSANAARSAARYRYDFALATAALDVDTTYTRALAARDRAELSRRNAADADSLRRIAIRRRDAGDASELDVALASVAAGQQANLAASDSLTYASLVIDLQTLMGMSTLEPGLVPTDALVPPAFGASAGGGVPLEEAAAARDLAAADLALRLEKRSVFGAPALTAGIETGDPGGSERGILPTIGIALPLPFFDRHRGAILQAEAEQSRARAALALARLEGRARITRSARERALAQERVERDRGLIASAEQVARLSIIAYREGESTLPNVLEAQRSAREILAQYIDDVAALWIATASLRLFTLSTTERAPR